MNRTATTIKSEIAAAEARLAELRTELAALQAPAMRLTEVTPGEAEAAAPALTAKEQAKLDRHVDTALGNSVWVAAEPNRRDSASSRGAATRAINAAIKLAAGNTDALQAAFDRAGEAERRLQNEASEGRRKDRRVRALPGEARDVAYRLGLPRPTV